MVSVSYKCIAQDSTEVIPGEPTWRQPLAAKAKPVRLNVDLMLGVGVEASEFFNIYQSVIGGKASGFDMPIGFSAGIMSFQFKDVAIGVMSGYSKATLRETFTVSGSILDTIPKPTQTASETILMTVIPAMLTLDYFPLQRQFTGYVGAGAGIVATDFYWNELYSSSDVAGARRSGLRYDDAHISPAFIVRTGISFGLDKRISAKSRAALSVELSYSYMPVSMPLFKRLHQLEQISNEVPESVSINAGGVRAQLGFSIILL